MEKNETKTEDQLGKISKNLEDMNDTIKGIWGKSEPDKPTMENIDKSDFEETRRCLLNSYHSYVQNHVGYMIAIVIGFVGLVSSFSSFFKNIHTNFVFLILTVSVFFIVAFCDYLRIQYWTSFANTAIILPKIALKDLFDKYPNGKKYHYTKDDPPPNTVILQLGISYYLWDGVEGKNKIQSWRKRQWLKVVLRTGGKSVIENK